MKCFNRIMTSGTRVESTFSNLKYYEVSHYYRGLGNDENLQIRNDEKKPL